MAGVLFLYNWVVFVYRCIVTLIGIPGNILILAVYWNKKSLGSAQVFIQFLAICDLYAGLIFPLEAHYWFNEFDYQSPVLCKIFFSLFSVGFYLSACVTVAIAMDRYLAVSKPVKGRWSRRKAKMVCLLCVIIAILVNAVMPFTSGLTVVSIEDAGVFNATTCEQRQNTFEGLALLLTLSQYSCSLVFFVLIILLYVKLWRTLKKRGKVGGLKVNDRTVKSTEHSGPPPATRFETHVDAQESSFSTPKDQSALTEGTSSSVGLNFTQEKLPDGTSNFRRTQAKAGGRQVKEPGVSQKEQQMDPANADRSVTDRSDTKSTATQELNNVKATQRNESGIVRRNAEGAVTEGSAADKRKASAARPMSRLSQMLLLSTIIFLFTYTLTLAIFMLSSLTQRLHRNSGWFAAVAVIRLSGSINHAINPVIYSFMNPRFRSDCSLLFKRMRSKYNWSVFGR